MMFPCGFPFNTLHGIMIPYFPKQKKKKEEKYKITFEGWSWYSGWHVHPATGEVEKGES
jgi:hypothetical protein